VFDGMRSLNFDFLRPKRPELAALGGFAENYAYPDPVSALVKLRSFAEQMVLAIYHELGLPKPFQWNLNDLLNETTFDQAVPHVVVSKLHALRINGNKAAHGEKGSTQTALWLLQEGFDLGRWFFLTFDGGTTAQCPRFLPPSSGGIEAESKQQLKREKKEVIQKLAAQEAQMLKLLADLEEARARAATAQKTSDELQALLRTGTGAADELQFDEETTRRRLIDEQLVAADWNVGAKGTSTEHVVQEETVEWQPTQSGIGYADYVLKGDDGKSLAVIEAKKTSKSPELGRTQAKLYADGLEKTHGRRPIIYYTNGVDIFLWNDGAGEPPRKVYGFYSQDSLQYLHFQVREGEPATAVAPNPAIANRMYQIEAVKRVVERFAGKHRRALVVQATGTGKTRVAVSLCDALLRAKWVKRILFLCDRRELRKQADGVFKQFMPSEPRTIVTAETAKDRDKRIYLATYPAMMKCYESFDVGFFDLIIADESHRSIYNRYRDLFLHFDALQVGLTATPVRFIARNTYRLFGCEDQDPTVYFSFEEAIGHDPPYLVPFQVQTHTTQFLRQGIRYRDMSPEQQRELEEQEANASAIDVDAEQVDRQIFNKDTNRAILRNLMEYGVRDATGSRPGRTIVFARNHNHAVLLQNLFDQMYPQYGGNFCRVIDNYDSRAEQLIDDFKGEGHNPDLTIAISVDMLDTGIDVPEIVNLVFAKPIRSYVKFWQMIGRGTRLCENLFGPGRHKTHFLIIDHWGNFDYFGEGFEEAEPKQTKSLLQRLFESRFQLAEVALQKADVAAFDLAVTLIGEDIAALPEGTIAIRDKWREIRTVGKESALKQFEPATKAVLRNDIAPLMQWRDAAGNAAAYECDHLIAKMQIDLLRKSGQFVDYRDQLLNQIEGLQVNLSQVRAKADAIAKARSKPFWDSVSVQSLEEIRRELRGIMQYRQKPVTPQLPPKVIDVREDAALIERRQHIPKLEGLELAAYRNRVEQVLQDLFDDNETLHKIKAGEAVSETDLDALNAMVLAQNPDLDLNDLLVHYPNTANDLAVSIRRVIGLDAAKVHAHFTEFVHQHSELNSTQIRFLSLLENHISKYGAIELERLYESPFTTLHSDGVDGVFKDDRQINELLAILSRFERPAFEGSLQ
jgi:type I restriction enzyme R subunit